MDLRYGNNPHQSFARAEPVDPANVPVKVVNGAPSMINLLDALNAWQLVRELRTALDMPAATSFKHVSPAGAAVAEPLSEDLVRTYEVGGKELSPLATAYVRARGADPKSSFGDFVAVSDPLDVETAKVLKFAVSDGLIAPGFEEGAFDIVAGKKGGKYLVLEADPDFTPPEHETRELFGMKLTQDHNARPITGADIANPVVGELDDAARRDLILGLITLKFTQSNSVAYSLGGQMIGIGAGQQSRVDCTKLAGAKADTWHLRRHPKILDLPFAKGVKKQERINWRVRIIEGDLTSSELDAIAASMDGDWAPLTADERADWMKQLTGVAMVSDGFIPFRDNIDHASMHGVSSIAQPGGSIRDDDIQAACRDYGISLVHTGVRLFHH
ncbi:MAG: phosphoribosylaminoimidazolecarboxamide formyltransferase [Planctomycetota bacterium]